VTDAVGGVPNQGKDVDDATEPSMEYDQLGSDGNPFERADMPKGSVRAESSDESFSADADFGMGIAAANDPQQAPGGPGTN
jgi:hypothetical protein